MFLGMKEKRRGQKKSEKKTEETERKRKRTREEKENDCPFFYLTPCPRQNRRKLC